MSVQVLSPVTGLTAPISEVPDPVFSQAMVGPGVAVKPSGGSSEAVAPVEGTLSTLHPHAFVVSTDDGKAVLVHLGIDTVKLEGAGFTVHATKGERVTAGQPVVTWNPTEVEQQGYSSVCPVVVLDVGHEALSNIADDARVSGGDPLFTVDS
ncbi:PTS glucose transporter subunit IIA [Actinopolyspora erythraea]|uniref:PTS glucose transporter subunit IIA n=1 Tax=Actinopolyspora erythraea TaxID=414996 RepID=A0A099D4Z3_9ACTN|nr:PTS glucose transporter subunit IIA [Actinopolyspora erythraea]ASU79397.1 PTS glucose transporter subunit IIA [Actinopolyspora erythraea]KGI80991.1 PTS glucose transporter subunit IIA [Actinopolyspora erythraea]